MRFSALGPLLRHFLGPKQIKGVAVEWELVPFNFVSSFFDEPLRAASSGSLDSKEVCFKVILSRRGVMVEAVIPLSLTRVVSRLPVKGS